MSTGIDSPHFWEAVVAACNACAGLTPEQVAAIPRLVEWFTDPSGTLQGKMEYWPLRAIFPLREAP